MSENNTYDSSQIKKLTDREHVRLRTQIYLGNMTRVQYQIPLFLDNQFKIDTCEFVPAVFKSLGEIKDNSIDELTQNGAKVKRIDVMANPKLGWYHIADNGRGIPIDMHESGEYTPQVALSSLRAGRNFSDKEVGVIGQNGVGASCVNYCSIEFNVNIKRDGKKYSQTFTNGADTISEPTIIDASGPTGTAVSFILDPGVFTNGTDLPENLVRNRCMEIAFNNPGLTVTYTPMNDTLSVPGEMQSFQYANGFSDIIPHISKRYATFKSEDMEFFVAFDLYKGQDELMYTWVNSSLLFDGGICNTQFINAFSEKVADHLSSRAKKARCEVTKNDVRENLAIFGILKVKNPEYDSQSKTRLTGPNLRNKIIATIDANWKLFCKNHTEWFDVILERAARRAKRSADDASAKELAKLSKKKVLGLLNANSKDRSSCVLIITEGDSASNQITSVRDPNTMGVFALTGKINNVYGNTAAQILNMGKVKNLIASIGLIPGKRAVRSQLQFKQLWIATDADQDGDDIMTLLTNLFYQMWPELFDPGAAEPFICRLVAPNVVAYKGSKRVHFVNRADFDKNSHKYAGYTIEYFKGLGSMWIEDWKMVMSNADCLIPVFDDGFMATTLTLLFGPDADMRKRWLQGE